MLYQLIFGVCLLSVSFNFAMSQDEFLNQSPEVIVNRMSLEEKIGQLCILAAVSDEELSADFMKTCAYKVDRKTVLEWIKQCKPGGIIFLGTETAESHKKQLDEFNSKSNLPLFVMQDLEWGLTMRFINETRFPLAMTLGALPKEDDFLIKEMGYLVGYRARQLGIHMNLAPVVDVNNNAQNPVIYMRSFGDNPNTVSRKAIAYMKGMQSALILTCAKHFPGHGNTNVDSHHGLPIVPLNRNQLKSLELIPFKALISENVDAVMVGHIALPLLEQEPNRPVSLSFNVINNLLRRELEFPGFIIPDALNMNGITNSFKLGDIEVEALKAGNNFLLCPVDAPIAIASIKKSIEQNIFSGEELNKRVLKIITAKQNILKKWKDNPLKDPLLHSESAVLLKRRLYSDAITLVHDADNIIPLRVKKTEIISIISIAETGVALVNALKKEYPHAQINIVQYNDDLQETLFLCDGSKAVIINLLGNVRGRVASDLCYKAQELVKALNNQKLSIIGILSASPYLATYLKDANCLIVAYENDPDAQEAAAQIVAGSLKPRGHLPVTLPGING